MRQKTYLQIIKTQNYAYHPEKATNGKVLHESDLYSLADATPEEIKAWGLFLIHDDIKVKDLEK